MIYSCRLDWWWVSQAQVCQFEDIINVKYFSSSFSSLISWGKEVRRPKTIYEFLNLACDYYFSLKRKSLCVLEEWIFFQSTQSVKNLKWAWYALDLLLYTEIIPNLCLICIFEGSQLRLFCPLVMKLASSFISLLLKKRVISKQNMLQS